MSCRGGATPPILEKKRNLFMLRQFMFLVMLLLLACAPAGAAEPIESPKECSLCRMDRATYAQNRMLITYADGTISGACGLRCAIEEMKQNEGKVVKSIQVADYTTGGLIDARTATWVVGGKKPGGMN